MASLLDGYTVRIGTNLWFPINVKLGGGTPGGFSILDLIRPEVQVLDPSGNVEIDEAPNGAPSPIPVLPVILILLALALIAYAITR